MDNCLFCKIGRKEIPAKVVFENDELLVFHDINPAAPVHVLIIPKQHVASLQDCDASHAGLIGRMNLLATQLAVELGCSMQTDTDGNRHGGYKTMFNTGPDGGQEIYHLHLHLIGGALPWHGRR